MVETLIDSVLSMFDMLNSDVEAFYSTFDRLIHEKRDLALALYEFVPDQTRLQNKIEDRLVSCHSYKGGRQIPRDAIRERVIEWQEGGWRGVI